MKLKPNTTISLSKGLKARLDRLRADVVNEEGRPYADWDEFFEEFIDYLEKNLQEYKGKPKQYLDDDEEQEEEVEEEEDEEE